MSCGWLECALQGHQQPVRIQHRPLQVPVDGPTLKCTSELGYFQNGDKYTQNEIHYRHAK
jgi:hypothetical protein